MPTASRDKRSAPSVETTKWSWPMLPFGIEDGPQRAERDGEPVAGLARDPLPATAPRSPRRAPPACPRRAARILRRSRAFFDFHASGGIGSPCRRTRKPPSVWSVSGAGPSEPAAISTPAERPAVSRKPSSRSSRSIRSASSLAPERRARRELDPGGRDRFAELAPERKRFLEQATCLACREQNARNSSDAAITGRAPRRLPSSAASSASRAARSSSPRRRATQPATTSSSGRSFTASSSASAASSAARSGSSPASICARAPPRAIDRILTPRGSASVQRLLVGDAGARDIASLAVEVALGDEVPRRPPRRRARREPTASASSAAPSSNRPARACSQARKCRPSLRISAKPMRSASSVAALLSDQSFLIAALDGPEAGGLYLRRAQCEQVAARSATSRAAW